jgi:hypothetical protein
MMPCGIDDRSFFSVLRIESGEEEYSGRVLAGAAAALGPGRCYATGQTPVEARALAHCERKRFQRQQLSVVSCQLSELITDNRQLTTAANCQLTTADAERARQVREEGFIADCGKPSELRHPAWFRLNASGEAIANGPREFGRVLCDEDLEPAAHEERNARKLASGRASYRRYGQRYNAANKARRRDWWRILTEASAEKAQGEETAEDAEAAEEERRINSQ